ncbi:hypothetical protein [Bartonella machadoae]|uniref:hypothetical protein n=1 Tax=Bartonella machadoae TaxID=2893471 RepID=UPI001F4CBE39|nr:hypothetical protein [Bartonella machadoae]UNE55467.1 hypothetical protein LNM86_06625 [Bartonella machadoae]
MIDEPHITISKVQLIDLVNNIGEEDIYYGVRSPHGTHEISLDPSSTDYLSYMLYSIFARDDRNYFPLLPYDDFSQWFSSVFTQAFTTWFDNYFSQELLSFYRLNDLILFMILVKDKLDILRLDILRDEVIKKRNQINKS